MVVETTARKATFAGGQSVLTFTFRTLYSNPEYIQVALVNLSSSTQVVLTYNVDYTVSVNTNGVGGSVTVSPTYSTGYNYVVYRQTSALQDSAYSDYNQFPAATLENNLDQLTMVAQEQQEDTSRTLTYPISASSASTILPVPLANAFLQWNPSASALINATIPDPSTLIKASTSDAQGGVEDTHYMTAAKTLTEITTFCVRNVSSSTSDITVVSGSSTRITLNSGTGANQIVKMTAAAKLPAVDGSLLTNIGFGTPTTGLSFNTAYQATKDGFIYINMQFDTSSHSIQLNVGATNNPVTYRATVGAVPSSTGADGYTNSILVPIKSGNYYRLINTDSDIGSFIFEFWPF